MWVSLVEDTATDEPQREKTDKICEVRLCARESYRT